MIAAVSFVTPVFLLFMAVGTVFGIGGTSVISRAMGEGRKEYAKRYVLLHVELCDCGHCHGYCNLCFHESNFKNVGSKC